LDDHEAITRLRRGDLAALEPLVTRYQHRALRAAILITRDRPSAEDAVQASFIALPRTLHTFDMRRPFAPWFMRSVINRALATARDAARQAGFGVQDEDALLSDDVPDDAPLVEHLVEARELVQQVRLALDRLTPDQRAVVVMRYYLAMDEAEMADLTGSPRGTIRWRLHEARRRLRVLLNRVWMTEEG
jgi:RNA polymerase sigma-70 factor (ECF subfamily)